MKKILLAASALFFLAALTSCKDHSSGYFSGDVSVKKFEYHYNDARVSPEPPADSEYKNDDDSVHISIVLDLDLPEGNSVLAHRIREWVSEQISFNNQLGKMYFDGNVDDAQAMADFYGKELLETIEKDIEAPIFNGYRSIDITASKYFENSKCVTWFFTVSEYMGGAHPSYTAYGATFRKSDGRMFGNDMVSPSWDDRQKLDSLMIAGLCEYFSDGVGEKVDAETVIHEYTSEEVNEILVSLPKRGPWFNKTGVDFLYQQYEITAYAFGMPEFIIPYDKMEGLLTPAAADLLK
ncbi:MAG: DUF3298 domain-containing protein [Bacteroidales bacterium]|nr:DUF3298 domain-containing protein [Bacteroidales bacterium]